MRKLSRNAIVLLIYILFWGILLTSACPGYAGDDKVSGRIYDFNYDYHKYDALGWLIIKWDADPTQVQDRSLMVVDRSTVITDDKGRKLKFTEIKKGKTASATYTMGKDGLHANEIIVTTGE